MDAMAEPHETVTVSISFTSHPMTTGELIDASHDPADFLQLLREIYMDEREHGSDMEINISTISDE